MADSLRASPGFVFFTKRQPAKSNILKKAFVAVFCALLGLPFAQATVIDFESLADSEIVTTQFADVTFQNAMVLTAGVSLNEAEFPPKSGVNVVLDNGGPLIISFINPMISVGGWFNYLMSLNFLAFDSIGTQIAATSSAFSSNLALSGDIGSAPNEFLQVSNSSGIASISISGDPGGGSFTMDDLTFTQAAVNPVSEPATLALLPIGLAVIGLRRKLRSKPSLIETLT